MQDNQIKEIANNVIQIELMAISDMLANIDDNFYSACRIIANCKGNVIAMGVGKSGHIARKISATLASTGTTSFFVHPTEALHGDLGMIKKDDVCILISYSGETKEILNILDVIKQLSSKIIAIVGNTNSTMAKNADAFINVKVKLEACPLNLAPTASTTATLVMGDAIASVILKMKSFQPKNFAFLHPGGSLGKKLTLKASDIMHSGDEMPIVHLNTKLSDALIEISKKRLGMALVVKNSENCNILSGVFTDGDLRRAFEIGCNVYEINIGQIATKNCKTITSDMLAINAFKIMKANKITSLPVVKYLNESESMPIGVVHIHDILSSGIID